MANKKKNNSDFRETLKNLKNEVKADNVRRKFGERIPSIIEFVENEKWLGLPFLTNPVELYPLQRILLKCFYRGSPGNENLELTEEELQIIRDHALDDVDNGDLINKFYNGTIFRELVIVWGRRCLSEDVTIVDPKTGESKSLGSMWDSGDVENIMSWSLDERTNDMKIINNCNLIYQGKQEVFRLTTDSGHSIEATANHPFMTQRGWVKLENLDTKHDKVAIAKSVPFFGNNQFMTETDAISAAYSDSVSNGQEHANLGSKTIYSCPKNIVSTYLRTLFSLDSDSFAINNITRTRLFVHNKEQARNIQQLLSRFGILSKIEIIDCKYTVYFDDEEDLLIFSKEIGFYNDKNIKFINTFINKEKSFHFIGVHDIHYVGEKRTFDLEVSDKSYEQNFTSEGFIVHNSGKDFITSIIALYEVMRLLETPGGNPYKTYNLGQAAPITILTVANSSRQAKTLFREIKDKVQMSPYFEDKIGKMTDDTIYLLTPADKEGNKRQVERDLPQHPGSVQVYAGHSNSDSLVGLSCFAILFDEIGAYKLTAGSSSGEQLYHNLTPATKSYARREPVLDENGEEQYDEDGNLVTRVVLDGSVVCISTPRGKEGIFYELYRTANEVNYRLMMRAATWQVNPNLPKSTLLAESATYTDAKFNMEYGAEFHGTAGESFFNRDDVKNCFRNKHLSLVNHGVPGITYFAHLDPASSSHNYALVVVHQENKIDPETGKKDFIVVVDHIMHWSPTADKMISVDEVDNYVLALNNRFHFGLVTYDHWNSRTSIQKMRKHGVPAKMTPFTRQYKHEIYDNLFELVISGRIIIPKHRLLENEMINLQRKWVGNSYKVFPKQDAECETDDIVDALAGACYDVRSQENNSLPQGKLMQVPVSPQDNTVWRSMQGIPYGVGNGQRVAQSISDRSKAHPFGRNR